MSVMDARIETSASRPAAERTKARGRRGRAAPIVPLGSVAGRALVAVIAIMTFLAALTIGAVDLVRGAAQSWESEVAREITVQIRPLEGRDIEDAVRRATEIARATPGIAGVRAYTRAEAAQLLEPWLGTGLDLAELPVPRLIELDVGGGSADLAGLRARLERDVPGASVDDHRRWVERLRGMAGSVVATGIGILALVIAATIFSVVFATRGTMAGNREVVEVLNLVGATDQFIAREFQRRFLRLGLVGGAIGGGAALAVFLVAGLFGSGSGAANGSLFGDFGLGLTTFFGVVFVLVLIAVAVAVTSRLTVARYLARPD
jgi:cell division transport system permease protein